MTNRSNNPIASALEYVLTSPNVADSNGETANLVDTTNHIAQAIRLVANALDRLGTANAATPMGAIEFLAIEVRNGSQAIAGAIGDLAEAVRESGNRE